MADTVELEAHGVVAAKTRWCQVSSPIIEVVIKDAAEDPGVLKERVPPFDGFFRTIAKFSL
jgi:hypothetical protein